MQKFLARKQYSSSTRNGIQSQAFKNYQGLSLKPDYFTWLSSLGKSDELQKWAQKMAINCISHRKKIIPINTKLIKKLPENNIVFNMCNDVALKYSCANICDKSNEVTGWTSYQLRNKSLYIETAKDKFEFCKINTEAEEVFADDYDKYKVSKLKNPILCDNEFFDKNAVPLKPEFIQEVICENLDWNDILWGDFKIKFNDFFIENVKSFKYYQNKNETAAAY